MSAFNEAWEVLLAPNADLNVPPKRPLSAVKRTWRGLVGMSANDPKRTSVTPRTDLAPIVLAPYIWIAAPAEASGSAAPASGGNLLLIMWLR
jgi:hypothetical protein